MVERQQFRTNNIFQADPIQADFMPDDSPYSAVLRGVVAMQAGVEGTGHEIESDMRTLELLVELGNNRTPVEGDKSGRVRPIRQRFGHPAISENATGKQVAVARNFRIEGDKLVHDSFLIEAARRSPAFAQDPINWIQEMAANHPAEIGESVVIYADTVWKLSDGTEVDALMERERPINAVHDFPILRPTEFIAVDFVNEGAFTHQGLYDAHFFTRFESHFGEQVFTLIDQWRDQYGVPLDALPKKIEQVMARYLNARKGSNKMSLKFNVDDSEVLEPTTEETEVEEPTLEEVLADQEELGEELDDNDGHDHDEEAPETLARIQQLEAKIAQLEKVVLVMSENMRRLAANQRKLEGEPIVRASARSAPGAPLDELLLPPAHVLGRRPIHHTQRQKGVSAIQTGSTELDPAAAALQRQAQRRKALNS